MRYPLIRVTAMNMDSINDFFEDVPEKRSMKNIFKKEVEYVLILAPLELSIANYYLEHPHITDQDVVSAVKKFKENYDKEPENGSLVQHLRIAALSGLSKYTKKKKISKHEFFLVLDYIPWAVSNRDWIRGGRGYLNWLCGFFGLDTSNMPQIKTAPMISGKTGTGRNDPCPCGSGKKYKKCCMLKEENA